MSTDNTRTPSKRRAEPISKRTAKNGAVTYEFRVDVGLRPDGTRDRRRFTYRTMAEARREYRRVTAEVAAGTYTAPSNITVKVACEQWLAGKRDIREVTREGYRFALLHAERAVGDLPLQHVTKAHLDAMVEKMLSSGSRKGKPLSHRQVQFTMRTLRAVFEDARKQGMVARNVAELVEVPRGTRREMKTWTLEQARQFAAHVRGNRLAACWSLTLEGLRRSEVLGLAWSAVDFEAGTVSIVASRVAVGTGKETMIGDPKSSHGRRVLPMPEVVMKELRALRTAQNAERLAFGPGYLDDHGLVARHEDGRPIRPEWYSDEFARQCEAAKVPVIRLHDARHTSVSLALDAGMSIAAVSHWHGHSPDEMLRTYTHAQPDSLKAVGSTILGGDEAVA